MIMKGISPSTTFSPSSSIVSEMHHRLRQGRFDQYGECHNGRNRLRHRQAWNDNSSNCVSVAKFDDGFMALGPHVRPDNWLFRDPKNGVPDAVAISQDGQHAYLQRHAGGGGIELMECPVDVSSRQTSKGRKTLCVLPGEARAIDVSTDGSQLAMGIDRTVYTWNREQGLREVVTLPDNSYKIDDMAYLSDGSLAVTGSLGSDKIYYLAAGSPNPVELRCSDLLSIYDLQPAEPAPPQGSNEFILMAGNQNTRTHTHEGNVTRHGDFISVGGLRIATRGRSLPSKDTSST